MAIPATQVWEVRPANGTADAGGGFDAAGIGLGSDFSQQNNVQVNFDGAVILAATGGADSTITLTGRAVLGNDRFNTLAITGGTNFLTGLYSIRVADAAAAKWTLDRVCTSGAGANMTGNMGGARLGYHKGSPVSSLSSALVAGNTVYIKNEAWNEQIVLSTSGASGSPIKHIGYNATRDDISLGSDNTNNPTLNRGGAAGDGISTGTTTANEFQNINSTQSGDAGFTMAGGSAKFVNVRSFSNTGEGIETSGTATIAMEGVELDNNGAQGSGANVANVFDVASSNIHDNGGVGLQGTGGGFRMQNSILDSNSGNSLLFTTASVYINNNTFWNNSGANADHVNLTTPSMGIVKNNILSNASRFGVNATNAGSITEDYNDFFNNSVGPRNPPMGSTAGWGPATHDLAIDPQFTSASGANFTIIANLPGFPGTFPGGNSVGNLKMGAVQPASGGASVVNIGNTFVL